MSDAASHISIQGVHKVFESGGQEVHALKAIDLEIPQGQFVCLLGPSGCGKSTLLNAVAGFSLATACLLYTSPSPRDGLLSRMPSSA